MNIPKVATEAIDDVLVLDHVLPTADYDRLQEYLLRQNMGYGAKSDSKTDPHGHWSRSFVDNGGADNLADVAYDLEANKAAETVRQVWETIRDRYLPECLLIRCYMNGYTYGTDGYFHTDSKREDEYTAILYVNEKWEPDWAGETVFLNDDDDIIKSALPKPNRLVIFPARMRHAARSVSRQCLTLRRVLVFKARKRRSELFENLSLFLWVNGATRYGHIRGSLHDHLMRTFALLEKRGCDPAICLAGGLHSIYGTSAYHQRLLAPHERGLVKEAFGEEAEQLAYSFSCMDRPAGLESPVTLTSEQAVVPTRDNATLSLPRKTFDNLRLIECANLADQKSLEKYPTLHKIWNP